MNRPIVPYDLYQLCDVLQIELKTHGQKVTGAGKEAVKVPALGLTLDLSPAVVSGKVSWKTGNPLEIALIVKVMGPLHLLAFEDSDHAVHVFVLDEGDFPEMTVHRFNGWFEGKPDRSMASLINELTPKAKASFVRKGTRGSWKAPSSMAA